MKVQSTVMPEYIMMKKGKKLVSFDVVESVDDDGITTYTYEQLHLPETYNDEQVVNAVDARRRELSVKEITPLQAKLQLLEMGLLDEVEAMVATDRKVQLYWEYASVIEREHETLKTMAVALGLTDEQLDEMFIAASKLK